MNLRKLGEILVPSIAITVVIMLIYSNQPAHSAAIDQVSAPNEQVIVNEQPEVAPLTGVAQTVVDANLTAQSSIEDILLAMQNAHLHYDTLHLVMVKDEINGTGSTDEVWLSQSQMSFKHTRVNSAGESTTTVSDGIFTNTFFSKEVGNVVVPANTDERISQNTPNDVPVIVSNWFDSMMPTVGMLIMPSDFARIEIANSDVSILGVDVLLNRSTVKLQTLTELGGYNLWVDSSTGIILRAERIAYDGVITYSFTITKLDFNPEIDPSMFYVDHAAYDPQMLEALVGAPQE